jgi:hypothetical protein
MSVDVGVAAATVVTAVAAWSMRRTLAAGCRELAVMWRANQGRRLRHQITADVQVWPCRSHVRIERGVNTSANRVKVPGLSGPAPAPRSSVASPVPPYREVGAGPSPRVRAGDAISDPMCGTTAEAVLATFDRARVDVARWEPRQP